jgi:dolichol-phosphate mannosyltransferase
VPSYQEAENLPLLVPRITETLAPWPHEIIIVDDNSKDGTEQIIATLQKQGHAVRLVLRTDERGLSSAVLRGFSEAKGKLLFCMDADLSHPPEAVSHMVEMLERGEAEFVLGSRYVKGGSTDAEWGFFRMLNSKVATMIARPFCRVNDPLAGFFALPRSVLDRAESLNPIGYKIGLELIVKCGCSRIAELPICFRDRHFGESKLSLREQINYLRHVKRLADFKFGVWWQLGQFCIVGASGLAVDLLCYWLLLKAEMTIPLARALAIFVASSWNFVLNRQLSFAGQRFGKPIIRQYFFWLASTGLGAAMSWSVSVGLTSFSKLFAYHVFAAALLGIVGGSLSNFLLARYWVFPQSREF